ncbi:MAG: polysaccharide biosynthesis/export family protein [Bryobacterales bacterium]
MTKQICAWMLTAALLAPSPALLAADKEPSRPFVPANQITGDYQIGPNDKLKVSVFGVNELDLDLTVSASGSIVAPHIGRLYVSGMSPAELEERIAQELTSRALVKDPQVTVSVEEYNSQPIYVLGAVAQPGQFMMSRSMSVVDAITMAGGLDSEKAGAYILIRRGKGKLRDPNDEKEYDDEPVYRVDVKRLLEQGDVSQDIALQGGDVVQVPARKVHMFYVIGEVSQPGAFEFKEDQEGTMLATRALGWAGGAGKTADLSDAVLIRNTDGGRQEIALDFKRILKGKDPDTTMQADDIIFVPGSTTKTITQGLLTVLPSTLSGIVIWNSAMGNNNNQVQTSGRR